MSLTEASYYFRKIAPFAILSFIVLFILYYSAQLVILLTQLRAPEAPPIASIINTTFGVIPKPIVGQATSSAGFNYTLDTIDGVPVTATEAATIYFLPQSPARFGFRENVYLMAKTLGINTELTKYRLDGNTTVFSDAKNKLTVDITNFNFDYEYLNLANEDEALSKSRIPDEKVIADTATQLLSKLGRYPGELARGKSNIIYLAFNPQSDELTVVKDADNANLVEVDFYRADIDTYPVATPRYFNSQNYMILLFGEEAQPKVIKARISFFERSDDQTGIYPVKSGDQAWEDFTSGGGYVISGGDNLTDISIRRMFMAYFDPDIRQDYLQPVYVFLGDNNFVGYVPAVSNDFLTEATPSATPTQSLVPNEATTEPLVEESTQEPTTEYTEEPVATDESTPTPEVVEEPTFTPTPTRVPNIRQRLSLTPAPQQ